MHDDIAWEQGGTPAELKQLKLHVSALRNLTDASDDMWRTLRVWMDNGRPRGSRTGQIPHARHQQQRWSRFRGFPPPGPGRDVTTALAQLENTARDSTSKETRAAREQFLRLTPTERVAFVGRIYIADQSADIRQG